VADFRQELYRRYVSAFASHSSQVDERVLEAYWEWCEHKFLPLLDGLDRGGRVLELGCGPGYMLDFLKRHGFTNAEGIDVSDEQVRRAAERGLTARVADVFEALASEESSLEAVIAIDFVEHFSRDEVLRLFPAVHRALRPGGLLLLQTPNGEGLFSGSVVHGDLTHLTIFTAESLAQALRLAGFHDLAFQETGPVPRGIKERLRVLLWKLVKLAANTIRRIEHGKRQELWTENIICSCRKPASRVEGRGSGVEG
jgi:SAM-dependent methyltransferase